MAVASPVFCITSLCSCCVLAVRSLDLRLVLLAISAHHVVGAVILLSVGTLLTVGFQTTLWSCQSRHVADKVMISTDLALRADANTVSHFDILLHVLSNADGFADDFMSDDCWVWGFSPPGSESVQVRPANTTVGDLDL